MSSYQQTLAEQKESLINLASEIIKVLEKIKKQIDIDQSDNAKNGRYEFAYVKYYLEEVTSLLNFSIYLLKDKAFAKYAYFPARLIMEITLQLEHVYSIKSKKGLNAVRRLFFKDIAVSAKSSLASPGERGKDKMKSHLNLLDVASRILRLDFKTSDVSAKSKRDIKTLCDKSCILGEGFLPSPKLICTP